MEEHCSGGGRPERRDYSDPGKGSKDLKGDGDKQMDVRDLNATDPRWVIDSGKEDGKGQSNAQVLEDRPRWWP